MVLKLRTQEIITMKHVSNPSKAVKRLNILNQGKKLMSGQNSSWQES